MNIATTLVRRARRLIAPLHPVPQPGTGAAATRPCPSPSDRTSGGGTIAAVHTSAGVERVHGGSDDLDLWPASLAELELADRWLTTGDLSVAAELYDLCGSQDRAVLIALDVRHMNRAAEADAFLSRVFGHQGGAR